MRKILLATLAFSAATIFFVNLMPALVPSLVPAQRLDSAVAQTKSAPAAESKPAITPAESSGEPESWLPAVQTEASALDQITEHPEESERRLEEIANRLNPEDAKKLAAFALSDLHSHNERFVAVYALSKRIEDFLPQLETIAESDSPLFHRHHRPHTFDESNWHFEETLRVAALAAIDTSPEKKHLVQYFEKIEHGHGIAIVRKVARVGRVGAEQGEALVNSYLDAKAEGALRDVVQD